jgi:hypothetical protein
VAYQYLVLHETGSRNNSSMLMLPWYYSVVSHQPGRWFPAVVKRVLLWLDMLAGCCGLTGFSKGCAYRLQLEAIPPASTHSTCSLHSQLSAKSAEPAAPDPDLECISRRSMIAGLAAGAAPFGPGRSYRGCRISSLQQ